MNDWERKQMEDYLRFMGQWMAGACIGRAIGKIICWIAGGWIVYHIFKAM